MKKFTKIFTLIVLGLVSVSLVACAKTTAAPVKTQPTTTAAPITVEAKLNVPSANLELNVGDELDLKAGVTATGFDGKDAMANVTIAQNIPVDADGKVTTAGSYTVRYTLVINNEQVASAVRTVVVTYVKTGDDIIANGDFESGSVDPFTKSEFENGVCVLSVVADGENHLLKIEITAVAFSQAAPRVEQVIELEANKFYEVSFQAKADAARAVHVQVGELLAADPWFINVDPTARFFGITTEMQTFTFRFQPNTEGSPDLTNLSITFEFGTSADMIAAGGDAATTVYIDNLSIEEVDSLGEDKTAPTVAAAGSTSFYVGDACTLTELVTVSDDQDKAPTIKVVEAKSTLPTLTDGKFAAAGEFVIVYEAEDASGNKKEFTLNITVSEAPDSGSELIANNDFADATATADGFTSWIVFADAGVGSLTSKINEGGEIELTADATNCTESWHNQFKQNGIQLIEGHTYVLTLEMKSTLARKVQVAIQNETWWNMHIEKIVEVGTEYATYTYVFTAAAPSPNVLFFIGLGKVDGTNPASATVSVKGLSLKEVGDEILVDTAFENVNAATPSWAMWGDNGAGQSITGAVAEGVLTLNVTATGSTANYSPQFKQDHIALSKDAVYVFSITLKSSVARTVQLLFQSDGANGGSWAEYNNKLVELAADTEVTLTYMFTQTTTDSVVLFMLGLGKIGEAAAPEAAHTVAVSKISLRQVGAESGGEVEEPEVDVPAEGAVLTHLADNGDNVYTITDENEDGMYDIAYANKGEWSCVRVDVKGATAGLILKISAKGAAGDVLKFKPNDDATYEYDLTLTGGDDVFEYPVAKLPAELTKLIIFMNGGKTAEAGSFTMKLEFIENEAPAPTTNELTDKLAVELNVNDFYVQDTNANVYTITEQEDGSYKFDYVKAGQWNWMKSLISGVTNEFGTIKLVVKGPEGVQIIIKPNDNGSYEKFHTFTGGEDTIYLNCPENIASIVYMVDPVAVSDPAQSGTFYIMSAVLMRTRNEIKAGTVLSGYYDINNSGYTFAAGEDGMTMATYKQTGWNCFKVNLDGASYENVSFKVTVSGAIGEKMLVKLNDQIEYWITLESAKDTVIVPADKLASITGSLNSIVFFCQGGVASEGVMGLKVEIVEKVAEGPAKLDAPVGLVANLASGKYTIAWAAVNNAVSYVYFLYLGEEQVATGAITNGGQIDIPETAGTYKIYVQAIGDGTNYLDSDRSAAAEFVVAE